MRGPTKSEDGMRGEDLVEFELEKRPCLLARLEPGHKARSSPDACERGSMLSWPVPGVREGEMVVGCGVSCGGGICVGVSRFRRVPLHDSDSCLSTTLGAVPGWWWSGKDSEPGISVASFSLCTCIS